MNQIIHQKYPDSIFIGNTPLVVLAIGAVTVGLMFVFSIKIYKWEVRLMYGRVLNKLEQTIAEMEELKKGA